MDADYILVIMLCAGVALAVATAFLMVVHADLKVIAALLWSAKSAEKSHTDGPGSRNAESVGVGYPRESGPAQNGSER